MADATALPATPMPPQQVHPAFSRRRSTFIASLNLLMEEYEHRVTGALHYHLASNNPENVFLVAFRTMPMDSTGVAHILEHTVLCGSRKYPVRDPFFMMTRRSLNTFMNAFTSSDWTAYPFASKNRKDFDNLLSVYLDAAFFARLHELDFAQEGHRLEFAEAANPDSELQYKGVVYNEMKGAMSSTSNVLWQNLCKHLFPTTTYHFNSGGDPERIPDLDHGALVDFYRSHYHPGNAVFMTYGDIPVGELHARFEDEALGQFQPLDVDIRVPDEQRYQQPLRAEESWASEQNGKSHVVLGWLLGRSTNLHELFRAQLLGSVLLDNSASPLLKALETTSLGSSPSSLCGLEDANREMTFVAGLEGCEPGATTAVETLVLDTLREVAANGVPLEQLEAALHQLELSQREISGDGYPYGLQLLLTGLSTAMHRGDPIQLLDIDPVLARLREEIRDPAFTGALIDELLLGNQHRVTLTLNPDPDFTAKQAAAETARLNAIRQALAASEVEQIIARSQALARRQAEEDDPEILPKVGLDDVPEHIVEPQRHDSLLSRSASPLSFYGQGTNGLTYQQVVMELPQLDEHLLEVLPLYTGCLTEFGVGDRDYTEVQNWQARISGGVGCFSSFRSGLADVQETRGLLTFSAKSLVANHEALSELLHETLVAVRFDESRRLTDLIEQFCARRENSMVAQGHSLAMGLAGSRMSPGARLSHQFGGLEAIRRLKRLRDELNDPAAATALLQRFRQLHEATSSAPRRFLLIAEPKLRERVTRELDAHWADNPAGDATGVLTLEPVRGVVKQIWTITTQVNFCATAFPTVPQGHEDNAVLHVLAVFLRNGFLHRAIREQGGAYGGGAMQSGNSASFRFFSYRDPRLQETLDDFGRAVEWLVSERHSARPLEEAILGVIAAMDKPSSPAGDAKQAFHNHLFGRTLAHRMEFRRRVLATSLNDLKRVAERYLRPAAASTGIVGNREAAEQLRDAGFEQVDLQG